MNQVSLTGRFARDPEHKSTQSGISVVSFTVAVDRPYQREKEKEADFISCTAWRSTADFISKYFRKGDPIEITGSLRTRTYADKNGTKHYVTEVLVSSVSFTQSKRSDKRDSTSECDNVMDEVGNLEDFVEILTNDEMPF